MAVVLSPIGGVGWQFFDNNGVPLAGGLIYTYQAGTSTQIATYTTSAGNVAHTNPIILDSSGRVPSGEIWLSVNIAYKFIVQTANAVQIGSYDNISGNGFTGNTVYVIATQGQTVFNYVGLVFVNGSKQIATLNYNQTSTTTTFIDGLNVGDVVEFI